MHRLDGRRWRILKWSRKLAGRRSRRRRSRLAFRPRPIRSGTRWKFSCARGCRKHCLARNRRRMRWTVLRATGSAVYGVPEWGVDRLSSYAEQFGTTVIEVMEARMMDPLEHLQMLKDSAAGLAPRTGDLKRIRALRFTKPGFDRATWRKMCEMGWLGLRVAEDAGGSGLGVREFCGLAEELGAG